MQALLPDVVVRIEDGGYYGPTDDAYMDIIHGVAQFRTWMREAASRAYHNLALDPGTDVHGKRLTIEERLIVMDDQIREFADEHLRVPFYGKLDELRREIPVFHDPNAEHRLTALELI